VEAPVESDEVGAAGRVAGELECGFDGLGAGVGVEDALGAAGRDGFELLGELDHALIIEIGAGHVEELSGLALHGFDDGGVAVAGGNDGDAGGEVEENVAVSVFDHGAASAAGDERIRAGIRRRDVAVVQRDDALGFRPGKRSLELGALGVQLSCGAGHCALLFVR